MKIPRFMAVLIVGVMLAFAVTAHARSPVLDYSFAASSFSISQASSPDVIAASRDVISAAVQITPAPEAAVISLRTNLLAPGTDTMKKPHVQTVVHFSDKATSSYATKRYWLPRQRLWPNQSLRC